MLAQNSKLQDVEKKIHDTTLIHKIVSKTQHNRIFVN